jgi:hypothetical protein
MHTSSCMYLFMMGIRELSHIIVMMSSTPCKPAFGDCSYPGDHTIPLENRILQVHVFLCATCEELEFLLWMHLWCNQIT